MLQLNVATSKNTLTIPQKAVTYSGGQPQVFVYAEERVALQAITLGIANEEEVEVLTGLHEGQQVVVDDPAILTNGMQVLLRPEPVARVTRRRSPQ